MKLHPTRNKQATKSEFRGRMMTEILGSARGQRVLRECQHDLDMPVNSDDTSRMLVVSRYASELDIYPYELIDLLKRVKAEPIERKAREMSPEQRAKRLTELNAKLGEMDSRSGWWDRADVPPTQGMDEFFERECLKKTSNS